jgi:hypothetical protein
MPLPSHHRVVLLVTVIGLAAISGANEVLSQLGAFTARDPGVRTGGAGAGGMLPNLSTLEQRVFGVGKEAFEEIASVQGTLPNTEAGLGPRFNLDSCAGCHAQPATGGGAPAINPQVDVAAKAGAVNEIPSFIKKDGPIREARFKLNPDGTADGGVHALFTITGRSDALAASSLNRISDPQLPPAMWSSGFPPPCSALASLRPLMTIPFWPICAR